jgi:choice-of-anchor A domain-containing protein
MFSGLAGSNIARAGCDIDEQFDILVPWGVATSGDFVAGHSEVEGRLSVGGDLDLHNYSIGADDPGGTVAAVHGSVKFSDGTIHGNLEAGGDASLERVTVDGTSQTQSVDFDALEKAMTDAAFLAANPAASGSVAFSGGVITLSSTDMLTWFDVSNVDLADADVVRLDLPLGGVAVIRGTGSSISLEAMAFEPASQDPHSLLWVFPDAIDLRFRSVGIRGSVIAPKATVDMDDGQIDGHLWAREVIGEGLGDGNPDAAINLYSFDASLCDDPDDGSETGEDGTNDTDDGGTTGSFGTEDAGDDAAVGADTVDALGLKYAGGCNTAPYGISFASVLLALAARRRR